ncbi:hypothetical protein NBH00_16540 [Paraconexibacter antarcticus]|uniref:NADH:ubiquinone oxidoreductase subunit F (NADH-binding) n=1 Tax=Paraconexibacter antarcticus TaxID=2949664 RepID=A0ABY5DM05_9ACTN|nr:NADH-ubiquinone oxidoreductase-F iron-sulfur binding region domain-containing protein [Paraconexibacter antarcticus]UTI62961.1 hypothetical protein NBH00_16540 [Paraconexibacter antarcticus]
MTLPRLLLGTQDGRALTHAEHVGVHGPLPAGDVSAALAAAGLRGRGGAAFPTARKLQAVAATAAAGRHRPVVLVNGAEGEPMSAKDRTLCARTPHLVLDGAQAAAAAIGARRVTVALPRAATDALDAMRTAVHERPGGGPAITVTAVPVAYLAGEESALIRHLDGGPLKPTVVPPRPAERGLGRRPTLVQNPETLAHVGLVARHGAAWFREAGTAADPGSVLVSLAGDVVAPGVYEVDRRMRLAELTGMPAGRGGPRAVLVGGYHGTWLGPDELAGLTLAAEDLAAHGATLAAGVIAVLGPKSCPVRELANVAGWLAAQSAGQCGPCANGLPAIATRLAAVADGRAPSGSAADLDRWTRLITGRGACHLPDGAARLVRSGLRAFAPEVAEHARRGPCAACRRPPVLRVASRVAA